ncbi:hypothetical protein [Alteromonas sp. A079]|uniref:hypothetical protein n=1 Tax=Alteromonas sp. A079 TaxID=3410268 RepID=UPI003B9FA7CC
MPVYNIKIKHSSSVTSSVHRWCLDSPVNDFAVSNERVGEIGIKVRGWLLPNPRKNLAVVLLCGDEVISLTFNEERPDVIEKVLKDTPSGHHYLKCGFRHSVRFKHADFSIGVIENASYHPLLTGTIEGTLKVLEGTDNWLFLDNDSNQSVEQYTGKLKISRSEKLKWKYYFRSIHTLSQSKNIPTCLLIAPSKENVYPQFYPYSEAKVTPIKQLQKIVPKSFPYIYPAESLRAMEDRSYRQCDTHWTLHGARESSILLAKKLLDSEAGLRELFYDDLYVAKEGFGDLGRKVYPPNSAKEDVLSTYNYRDKVLFDNNLPNFGRIIIIYNELALHNSTLLFFGSSSAYSMFHFLSRIFQTVAFVHTAGNVDEGLIEQAEPDYFCMQTNARFVIKSPAANDSVKRYIESKRETLKESNSGQLFVAETIPSSKAALVEYLKKL